MHKFQLTEDVVSALNHAIADRKRVLDAQLKKVTSEQWRKTLKSELAELELVEAALSIA